jgi:hypothetical protein
LNSASNDAFASGNEIDEYDDNGDDQQDVNESADGVTAHETKQPEDEQDYCDSI